jgi:glutathione S-transferase
MVAHFLKIKVVLVLINLFKGEQNSPEFLKRNPNHQVLVLGHDGFLLWESYAIMQYMADMAPVQSLYPVTPDVRADVNRWLFWCGQYFMPGASILTWENSIKALSGAGAPDPIEVARAEKMLLMLLKFLTSTLKTENGFSLADLAIAPPLVAQHSARFPVSDLHNLQRWFMQIQTLDCWKKTGVSTL